MARTSYRVQFDGGSGFELSGIVDRPDDDPEAPSLVLSHCFTCNKDLKAIVRISRALAEKGIAVLRYDMTGLGNSQGDFSQTNFTTNLADLAAAVQFAKGEFGTSTVTLFGHSFGGAASMAYAGSADYARNISALITLAAPSDTHHLAALLARMNPSIESDGVGTVTIGGYEWEIRRQMLEDFRSHDITSLIPRIQAPTMLLHSPVDKTLAYDHALRIIGLLQSSPETETPASLVTLNEADHLLASNPRDIEYVVEVASAFIQRHAR